mgnify:CR=1 FL=1
MCSYHQEYVILTIVLNILALFAELVKLGTLFSREHAQDATVKLVTHPAGSINVLSVLTSKQVLVQEYLQ